MLISIEIILLATMLLLLVSSLSFDDILVALHSSSESTTIECKIMYLAIIVFLLLWSIVFGFSGKKFQMS
jgi:hypothetical protein